MAREYTNACYAVYFGRGGAVLALALDESKAEVKTTQTSYTSDLLGFAGKSILVTLDASSGVSDLGQWVPNGKEYVEYISKNNENKLTILGDGQTAAIEYLNENLIINRTSAAIEIGDLVTVKAGLAWGEKETKSAASYLCNSSADGAWLVYAPTGFTANKTAESVMVGANKKINFVAAYEGGNYADAPVTYESSDENIVTVGGAGLNATITAVAKGTATITATLYGGKTATVAVTVEEITAPLKAIEVSGKISVYKGITALKQTDLAGLTGKKIFGTDEGTTEESEFTVELGMLKNLPADFNTVGTTKITVETDGKSCEVDLEIKERPALTITEVGYWHTSWGFNVVFTNDDNTGIVPGGETFEQEKIDKVEIVNSQGVSIKSGYNFNYNGARFVATPNGLPPAKIGSRITVKEGFIWLEKELKQDQTFVLTAASDRMVEYDPDTHDAKSITITTETDDFFFAQTTKQLEWKLSDGAAAFPSFTSSNEAIATVDENGLITGVAEGTATITATVGSGDGAKTATYELNVKPALPMDRVELKTAYKIWIEKGEEFFVPEDFTAVPVYKNGDKDFFGREFKLVTEGDKANTVIDGTVNTAEAGEQKVTLKVTYEGNTYDLQVELKVFAPVEMEIKEVAIVEWFNFASFVQFPNSTTNSANITDTTFIPSSLKFSYTRADGEVVESGVYNLGGGNIAILPAFINIMDGDNRAINLNNFNTDERFYREGDRIVLQAGFAGYLWTGDKLGNEDPSNKDSMKPGTGMAVRECVLKEQVTYIFDGSLWVVFAPTQDVKVPDGLNVIIGQEKNIGARRLPAGATEGSFTYSVADESIATVNKNGRITAKKLGTTEITVTLINREGGDIVKKITLNVVDGVIELSFGEVEKITVTKGTETPNLSGIGKLVYATGKTEDADFTNAVLEGYDKNTLGEQLVTVTVTVGDEEFSATITVVVEEEAGCGCGSSVAGYASIAFGAAILALAAVLMVRKKRAA